MNAGLEIIASRQDEREQLLQAFRDASVAKLGAPLDILEAGCGQRWELDLGDIPYELTGLDLDADALRIRMDSVGDLQRAIQGDLATAEIEPSTFDVIYNSFVLEHVRHAERILDNFETWLRPGGYLVLRLPDRNSVYGFFARSLPFSLHVAFHKYVAGFPDAGKPGHAPYPTVYENVVSRDGILEWSRRRKLSVQREMGSHFIAQRPGLKFSLLRLFVRSVAALSAGRLAGDHNNLTYILRKPVAEPG